MDKVDNTNLTYGHVPTVRPKIVVNVPRLPTELVEKFRRFYVPDISDAVGQLYTMDEGIRPIYQPMKRLVGRALTVKVPPGDTSTIQRALLMVERGDVLVIDSRGYTGCCGTGTGSMVPAIHTGLAGVVIDGAWRDVAEIRALDVPVYGRGISVFSAPKSRPGEINVPVCCGGVIVQAGDLVVCDEEGAVVVPRDEVERVAGALHEYKFKATLADWDAKDIERRKGETNRRYFEEVFKARGGLVVDAQAEVK